MSDNILEKNISYQVAATYFEITFTKFSQPKETVSLFFDSISKMSSQLEKCFIENRITRAGHTTGEIILERILRKGDSRELNYWFCGSSYLEKPLQRKDITLRMITRHEHKEIEKWVIQKAWPVAWSLKTICDPQQSSTNVHGETICFLHEGIFPQGAPYMPITDLSLFSLKIANYEIRFPAYACTLKKKKTFTLSTHNLIGQSACFTTFEGGKKNECLLQLHLDADLWYGKETDVSFEKTAIAIDSLIEGLKDLEKLQLRNIEKEPIILKMTTHTLHAYPQNWDLTYLKFSSQGKPISIRWECSLIGNFWSEAIKKENALALSPVPTKETAVSAMEQTISSAYEKNKETKSIETKQSTQSTQSTKEEIEKTVQKKISTRIKDYWKKPQPLFENTQKVTATIKNVTGATKDTLDMYQKQQSKKELPTNSNPSPTSSSSISHSAKTTSYASTSISEKPSLQQQTFSTNMHSEKQATQKPIQQDFFTEGPTYKQHTVQTPEKTTKRNLEEKNNDFSKKNPTEKNFSAATDRNITQQNFQNDLYANPVETKKTTEQPILRNFLSSTTVESKNLEEDLERKGIKKSEDQKNALFIKASHTFASSPDLIATVSINTQNTSTQKASFSLDLSKEKSATEKQSLEQASFPTSEETTQPISSSLPSPHAPFEQNNSTTLLPSMEKNTTQPIAHIPIESQEPESITPIETIGTIDDIDAIEKEQASSTKITTSEQATQINLTSFVPSPTLFIPLNPALFLGTTAQEKTTTTEQQLLLEQNSAPSSFSDASHFIEEEKITLTEDGVVNLFSDTTNEEDWITKLKKAINTAKEYKEQAVQTKKQMHTEGELL